MMANRKFDLKKIKDTELIKLVIAGSVDDGKSTLLGRMLFDCNDIYEDQLLSIKKTSESRGDKNIDLSLLTDGLASEREQKITIDVAYRYFATKSRRFVIADVPGHEQYTRNMITGASNANLAIVLVDASKGILCQTKRHLFIASLLGIPHILVAINKMDLVKFKEKRFYEVIEEVEKFSSRLKLPDIQFIPMSALKGDMVVNRGKKMNWYDGRTLYDYLENIQINSDRNMIDFRFPIQYVTEPIKGIRGYAGIIEGGIIKSGEEVILLPSCQKTKIKDIYYNDKKQEEAFCPQSITITLEDQVDMSRGDMIVRVNNRPRINNNFETMVCWFSDEPLKTKKSYLLKHTSKTTRCHINSLDYLIDINTFHRKKTDQLKMNEIGRLKIKAISMLMFDLYKDNRNTGSFILIDEISNNTVGAGIITKNMQEDVCSAISKNYFTVEIRSTKSKERLKKEINLYLKKKKIDFTIID